MVGGLWSLASSLPGIRHLGWSGATTGTDLLGRRREASSRDAAVPRITAASRPVAAPLPVPPSPQPARLI